MPRNTLLNGALIAATAAAGAACSIMDPIPARSTTDYFRGPALSASAPVGGASDAQASVPDCRTWAGSPACFYGGMGELMDGIEWRRQMYLGLARQVTNGNAQYNALLYPAGAAAVYYKLHGATNHQLLLPAAVAAAVYGFANAGVPERERHYLRAAAELQCVQMRHAAWLYRKADMDPAVAATSKAWVQWQDGHSGAIVWRQERRFAPKASVYEGLPLDDLIASLKEAVSEYGRQRVATLSALAYDSPKSGPSDAIERAKGKGGGAAPPKDQRQQLIDRSTRLLTIAQQTLDALRKLRAEIVRAPWRLQLEANDVERDVQQQLSARVIAPRDPMDVARELLARIPASIATAQAGENPNRMDPLFPSTLTAGLNKDSQQLIASLSQKGADLSDAWTEAQNFLDRHAQRIEQAAKDTEALGCLNRLPPVPAPKPASAPAETGSSGTGATTTPLASK